MLKLQTVVYGIYIIFILAMASQSFAQKSANVPQIGTVTVNIGVKPANTFSPDLAFGAGVDGYEKGDMAKIYTPANIRAMQSAGLRSLSYRLRTELGVEAWHWNPAGSWSSPKKKQGYWISSDHSASPINVCYGYSLPRRGNTLDQAGNKGYSRLDDGDPTSFWKSNPYLDKHFTGVDNTLHPQWIVVDFIKPKPVNALRILWGTPYATHYQIEYWDGIDPIRINENPPGKWRVFPQGSVSHRKGGTAFIKFRTQPIALRYLRILLTEASGTAPAGSSDVRDGLGFAIHELYLGKVDSKGRFQDAVKHSKSRENQTVFYTSSTDPWHRVSDLNPNTEQPGFDMIFKTGLTNNLPVMMPIALIYDTPENAGAQIRFLKSRRYPIQQIEMGEEPDGQYMTPEDYAALYTQCADVIHHIDPALELGGPGFQTAIYGWHAWPDEQANGSWMNRFMSFLRDRNRLNDFRFFSFEWYPFDNACAPTVPQLAIAPKLLRDAMRMLAKDGVPRDIPWIITEYGYSAFAGQAEVELPGAILNAEIAAQFLALGGQVSYLYGYEPNTLMKELPACDSWGNLMLFLSDDDRKIRCPMPTYYGAKLLTEEWVQPGSGEHRLYSTDSDVHNALGAPYITAFTVHRPDGKWAILILNKDSKRSHPVHIRFLNTPTGAVSGFQGRLNQVQYSPIQYAWKAHGEHGYPKRNLPPRKTELVVKPNTIYTLPPCSLTVLRGARVE